MKLRINDFFWCKIVVLFLTFQPILSYSQYEQDQLIMQSEQDGPSVFSLVDLDSDGLLDILCGSNNSNTLGWYKNEGGGEFIEFDTINSFEIVSFGDLEAIDIDSDGDLDVFYSNKAAGAIKVAWQENLGGGEFGPAQNLPGFTGQPVDIDFADFDADGFLDVLVKSTARVIYFKNDGESDFILEEYIEVIVGSDAGTSSLPIDIDGDGDIDVLSGSWASNRINLFKNSGGVFDPATIFMVINTPIAIQSTDIDGDGDLDLFALSKNDDLIIWRENLGTSFAPAVIISNEIHVPLDLKIEDIDADGYKDLIISNTSSIYLFKNLGAVTFDSPILLTDRIKGDSKIQVGEIDGDGNIDIASISFRDDKLAWYKNDGVGGFSSQINLCKAAADVNSLFFQDIDGDGKKDIVTASTMDNKISWFKNEGSSSFGTQQIITDSALSIRFINIYDLDDDGDNDIFSIEKDSGFIFLYENLGLGVFAPRQLITDQVWLTNSIFMIDLDGDMDLDLISASFFDDKLAWYENAGDGTFGPQIIISDVVEGAQSLYAYDIDEDGDNDIVVSNAIDDKIAFYENTGLGVFSGEQIIDSEVHFPFYITGGDLDNDGDYDLISTLFSTHELVWYENLEGTEFGTKQVLDNELEGAHFALVYDIDEDGDQDIISLFNESGFPDRVVYYENYGDGIFSTQQTLISNLTGVYVLEFGDIDEDGDKELIAASSDYTNTFNDKDKVVFYENNTVHPYQIRGEMFIDLNENGLRDSGEIAPHFIGINSTPDSYYTLTELDGSYYMNFDGTDFTNYIVFPDELTYWEITTDSLLYHVTIDGDLIYIDSLNFGFNPDTILNKVDIDLTGSFPRCNSVINYWINYENLGTTFPSGLIKLTLDDSISFVDANIVPDSIMGQTVYWHYDTLTYFAHEKLICHVEMPNLLSLGDTLISTVSIDVDSLGTTIQTVVDSLSQILNCGYDPNDKISEPMGFDDQGYIPPSTNDLTYTIRFQNTGTDTAFNVIIKDQIDPNLEWTSLEIVAWSHPLTVDISYTGLVSFNFNSINLPDSNINELASHGFIKYKLNLKDEVEIGTSIYNTANIYFDSNPPIVTNTKINTLSCIDLTEINFPSLPVEILCTDADPVTLEALPAGGNFSGTGVSDNIFSPADAGTGTHIIYYSFEDEYGCISQDSISQEVADCLGLDEIKLSKIKIYPNPANDIIWLNFGEEFSEYHTVIIRDVLGQVIYSNDRVIGSSLKIECSNFAAGSYLLSIYHSNSKELFNGLLFIE